MKNQKSVLLVEDDKDDQDFFVQALSEIKNAILYDIAKNGKEAIDKLENSVNLPDLIFMDINMPVKNGIECLSEIQKNPHTKDIPVVFLTTDTGKAELTRQLGARAFIKKPWDYKLLRRQIQQMIDLDFITDGHIANQTFQTALSEYQ